MKNGFVRALTLGLVVAFPGTLFAHQAEPRLGEAALIGPDWLKNRERALKRMRCTFSVAKRAGRLADADPADADARMGRTERLLWSGRWRLSIFGARSARAPATKRRK